MKPLAGEFVTSVSDGGVVPTDGLPAIALVGRSNVGKSSLLNALLQEDRAIVTPHPGTTRDTLEERVRLKDIHINIIDSAGLRKYPEIIEEEGMRRTRAAIERADLILVIFDRSQSLDENDDLMCKEISDKPKLVIINKCDLDKNWSISDLKSKIQTENPICISVKKQSGLNTLLDAIYDHVVRMTISAESIFITRERHRAHLFNASTALEKTIESLEQSLSEEFVAIDLDIAMNHLAAIIGKSIDEDLLDQIFNSFCIGK